MAGWPQGDKHSEATGYYVVDPGVIHMVLARLSAGNAQIDGFCRRCDAQPVGHPVVGIGFPFAESAGDKPTDVQGVGF